MFWRKSLTFVVILSLIEVARIRITLPAAPREARRVEVRREKA
jgi:hypothetical protein